MTTSALDRFEEHWQADQAAGVKRPLSAYLNGLGEEDQAAVARRFLSLESRLETEEDLATGATTLHQRYRIIKRLGSGGQGTVYLAEETTTLRRRVALKRLHGLDRPGSRHLRLRFQQGARVLSRLAHSHICGIIEANLEASAPYIVMAYVEGESLASKIAHALEEHGPNDATFVDLLAHSTTRTEVHPVEEGSEAEPDATPSFVRRERVALLEVVILIEQVARVLHWAHERGVLHRDIKPGNIMVTPGGEGVLMDFDMARDERPRTHELTRVGDAFGTPAYMAPELLSDEHRAFDRRSDIWALGVTLYQCLTLQRPFQGTTRQGLFQAILTREPPALAQAQPSAPRYLDLVIQKVLEKNPERRYASALEFADDLARVRRGEHPVARRPSPLRRGARAMRRRPGVALAVLFGIAVVGLGIALAVVFDAATDYREAWHQERRLRELTVTAGRAERPDPDLLAALERVLAEVQEASPALLARLRELAPRLERWSAESGDRALPPGLAERARRIERRIAELDPHRRAPRDGR